MEENLQDEILSFEDYDEYNIAYPVIITRWEIKKVSGLNKQYLQVYFQKLDNIIKAFRLNIVCYSIFGKESETISDFSIQGIDQKEIEFTSVIPLNGETQRVEITIGQCLLTDGSVVEKSDKQMVVSSFKPFAEEDRAAAQRLLPSAKGFPVDSATHWHCACGAVKYKNSNRCEKCGKSKEEIFSLITPERVQEEKTKICKEGQKEERIGEIKKIVLSSIVLIAVIFTLIPIICYMAKYPELEIQFTSVSGFVLCMIILLVMTILLLIMSIANLSVAVGGALKFERFKEERLCKKLEIMELIGIIACLIINILSVIISLNSGVHTVGNYNDYGSLFGFCIALSVLNLPLAVLYFVCDKDKVFHRIYKFFAKIKK